MRQRPLILILLVSLFPAALFSNTVYFSQVAFGGGYSTNIVIVNTGTTGVSGRLNIYTPSGVVRTDLGTTLNIAAGGSARVTVPNAGPLTTAWAEFAAGLGNVQGVATFDLRAGDGTLVTTAGVLGVQGGTRFLIPVDVTAAGATGLAVNNASTTGQTLSLRLISEDGTMAMTSTDTRFRPLGARMQVADFVTNIFPQLAGTIFKGTLVIEAPAGTATGTLGATALTVKEGLLSALPVVSNGSGSATTLEFPQVAFGDGYSTTITVLNASTVAVSGTLRFYSQSGAARQDLTTNVTIPGNGSTRYTLPDTGSLTVVWGELIATTGTIQGVATFERRAPNGILITAAGIPAVQPGNAYILPMDISATDATGVAVANVKDVNIGLRLRVLSETGADVPAAVDPRFTSLGSRSQLADFVTNIFAPLGTTFRGALSIEGNTSTAPNSVAAAALTVKEGLLSALPVIPNTVSSCKLPEAGGRGDVGLGFPRFSTRMPASGKVRVKMLFVDFSDAPAALTPQQVFAMISPGAPDFYRGVSYGRLDYQLDPYLVWLRMSKPSTGYGWSSLTAALHAAFVQEAVTLADPNVDFSTSDMVVVMANPGAAAIYYGPTLTGLSYTADGKTFYNGVTSGADLTVWGYKWLNHEAGHTMGLVDLYAFSGSGHRFVGGFSMMGLISGLAPEYLAYERWLLGWLDDAQISCQQNSDSVVTLTAIEQSGGLKAVVVPTGPTSAVVVESRRALGFDTGLIRTGALVYFVDTSIGSGGGPVQVYPNNPDLYQSLLASGTQVTVGKVTISVLQSTSTSDTVRVTVN